MLHKVKNFGNYSIHPDFCLHDEKGNEITNIKEFAKLNLEFLGRYLVDEYERDSLTAKAPKSDKELEKEVKQSN